MKTIITNNQSNRVMRAQAKMQLPSVVSMLAMLLAVTLTLISCGGGPGRQYVNEEADLGYYTNVGIIPFTNLTADKNASAKVSASFVSELLLLELMEVANTGDFEAAVTKILPKPLTMMDELTSIDARAIGVESGVEGIFVGAVRDYGMVRSGQEQFPLVSVIVRFIDSQTGKVVWSYETSRKGGPKFPIFSFGETHTLGEMTSKVCREVAESFDRVAR